MPRYLTTSEIANQLGLADSTIRHYRAAGRIAPRTETPGGHARYDLNEVTAALGLDAISEPPQEDTPKITGLVSEEFASLGEHDLGPADRPGPLPAEIVALNVREVSDASPNGSRRPGSPRWRGELLNARRRVPA